MPRPGPGPVFLLLPLLLCAFLVGTPAAAREQRFQVPVDDSPTLGPAEAPVTVVEFADYT